MNVNLKFCERVNTDRERLNSSPTLLYIKIKHFVYCFFKLNKHCLTRVRIFETGFGKTKVSIGKICVAQKTDVLKFIE